VILSISAVTSGAGVWAGPAGYGAGVIVWINGTFGVGKTTTSTMLLEKLPGYRLFDPEWVGYLLRDHLSDHEFTDFQQLPPWRTLVPKVAAEISEYTGQHLVAVQTVLEQKYWTELHAGMEDLGHQVAHVLLDASPDVLRARIDADPEGKDIRGWRHQHVEPYATARSWLLDAADHVVDTAQATPKEAAAEIIEGLNLDGSAR
jgi:AAA domain